MYIEEANRFLAYAYGKGFDPSSISCVLSAYDALSGPAKDLLPSILQQQAKLFPTLRDVLSSNEGPVSVLLVDRNGSRHALPPMCRQETPYLPEEEWLLSLPLAGIDNTLADSPIVALSAPFRAVELAFLGLTDFVPDEDLATLQDMQLRADMANAGFAERLAYLTDGKPFEVAFDPNSMDVVHSSERSFLCDFLQDYTDIYIRKNPEKNGIYYVYGIIPNTQPVDFDLLGIKLKQTPPGKGLTSTVAGKCAWAEHRAKKARAEVMEKATPSQTKNKSGKEPSL